MGNPRKIIIDTDISLGTPGAEIDDGVALLMLLNSEEVDVVGITTVHGNVSVKIATTNTLRLIDLAGFSGVPVFEGSGTPLKVDDAWLDFLMDWQSQYGSTPPWARYPNPRSAVDAIISLVEAHPGEISIIALGPLTNLALALQKAPHISELVESVVVMGGSLPPSSQAEFNIRCDPEAADIVFGTKWHLWLHGLEITRQCLFTPQDFDALDNSVSAIALLRKQAAQWIPVVVAQGWETGGCSLHDAVAAAAILRSDLFTYQTVHSIQVMLSFNSDRGITHVISQDPHDNLSVAKNVNARDCKAFIYSHLVS